ncbi:MAG: hypothetical protein ACRDOS_14300 [Gaiellaceae bacterium]
MRNRRRTWFLRRLVLGLAVAAIVVPAAQAGPDEGGAGVEPGYVPFQTDFPSSIVDRPVQGAGYNQFAYQRALPQDYGVRTVQLAQRDGFDWSDAGIGAGSALVLVLLAGGATLATRHVSRPATA